MIKEDTICIFEQSPVNDIDLYIYIPSFQFPGYLFIY